MKKENFERIWKASSRESILNQYFWDYLTLEEYKQALLNIESIVYNEQITGIEARISIQEVLDELWED